VSDIYLFGEPANDDRANESVTLTFSKFELQAVVNALREATAVLTRDSAYLRTPVVHEVTRAKAALNAVIGREAQQNQNGYSGSNTSQGQSDKDEVGVRRLHQPGKKQKKEGKLGARLRHQQETGSSLN
jgi:hypothetical protein